MTQNKISEVSSVDVRIEHLRDRVGIGTARPRLSWTVETESRDWLQTGYEIESYDPDGTLLDQTGRVESDQSVLLAWPFAPLTSREQLSVRVRVWDKEDRVSEWSEAVSIEAGLLSTSDWNARFITPARDAGVPLREGRRTGAFKSCVRLA